MSEIKRVVTLTASVLSGLFLLAMLFGLAIVLTTAMVLQYSFGEIPVSCNASRYSDAVSGFVPRPGHEYVGSAIFGIHMPVWSIFIALALLIGLAVRLTLFGGLRSAPAVENHLIRRSAQGLAIYVVFICAVNFLSVIVQCGMDQCHTSEYRLLH